MAIYSSSTILVFTIHDQEVVHEGGYITKMGPCVTDDGVTTA
jgi:hypothetical protein